MKVTMLLADAAQAVGGKLYILGGGWSQAGPGPVSSAIAIYIQIPWDQSNDQHTLHLQLLDSDGQSVPDESGNAVAIEGKFETGRPPGVKPGTPLDFALAMNIQPLALEPGSRFEWRLTIDGRGDEDWTLPFSIRPANPPGVSPSGGMPSDQPPLG